MDYPEGRLFNLADYENEIDDRLRIPEIMGRRIGEFMNTTRLVEVFLVDATGYIYVPGGIEDMPANAGYAYETEYDEDFTRWSKQPAGRRDFEGYLVGFPRITEDEQTPVDCLHIWSNNSSILDETYAIPLLSISNLFVYSQIRTGLAVELDELAMGGRPQWEVPTLRYKSSEEVYYRDASKEDISRIVEEMNELPVRVYGVERHGVTKRWRNPTQDELAHLLDPLE